jgi:hypothetical protein
MGIKIVWADAFALVANADETYELQFIFRDSSFSGKKGKGIPKGFTMRVPIPTQLPSTPAAEAFANATESAKSSVKSAAIGNFAVSMTMGASMSTLFAFINCQQVFVHIPLLNINFAANANMVEQ